MITVRCEKVYDDSLWIENLLASPMDNVLTYSSSSDDFIKSYTNFLMEQDIFFSPPAGLFLSDSVYHKPYRFIPNSSHISKYYTTNGISTYTPPYYSPKMDAMLIFPLKFSLLTFEFLIEDEFMAAFDDKNFDCTGFVKCIDDKKVKEKSNVDCIYYYEYDFMPEVNKDFRHCVGLVLRKKNHPPLPIKLLLTDEGLKNKCEYIGTALECIHYGDKTIEIFEHEENNLKMLREEGKFPLKRVSNTGIRIERNPLMSIPTKR